MRGDGVGALRLVFMIDGLGYDYFESGAMPFVASLFKDGEGGVVDSLWPTVTNVNNAAIACAAPPRDTGITGNSIYDPATGTERYMDGAEMLRTPTLLERWSRQGRSSCLLTAKGKSERLLGRGVDVVVNGQACDGEVTRAVGAPPPIYSAEVNHWLLDCLLWLLAEREDLDTFYVHTTDYPMHMWEPGDDRSKAHLRGLDERIRAASACSGDVELYLTADHAMNAKTQAVDLTRALERRGIGEVTTLSIEKDGLVAHHRDLGGGACAYLRDGDPASVAAALAETEGVEEVLTRDEAAARFLLDPARIGDLAVLADERTVFGELATERETLPPEYRSHGSLHERRVPLVRWGHDAAGSGRPPAANWELLSALADVPQP